MARRFSLLVLVPPALFAVIGVVFWLGLGRDSDQLPSQLIGRQAPAIQVLPLGDLPPLDTSVLRNGEVKLVNFWASWCAPCRVEHPSLMKLSTEEGMPVYGINYKDDPAKAEAFLASLGNPYTAIGTDPQAKMGFEWGVYGIPETFLIDGDGKVLFRYAGALTSRVIDGDLKAALDKAGKTDGNS